MTEAQECVQSPRSASRAISEKKATQNEKTLFGELRPMVIKGDRCVKTGKRTFDDEIKLQSKSFSDYGLVWLEDCAFVRGSLSLRNHDADLIIGPTNAQPDWVYGLRRQPFDNKVAMLEYYYFYSMILICASLHLSQDIHL